MSDSAVIEIGRESSTDPPTDDLARETAVSDAPVVESDTADLPPAGTVIDARYEVGSLLGQGGMGYVLSARHVVLNTRLALKVLRREMTRDVEIVERFRREARAASAIGHPNIVAVRDFGTLSTGASYFVMEHLEGIGLGDAIEKDGPFSVERAVDVVRQMADALGAAHAAGIVHRDVKPDNVVLTTHHGRPDHVKILDFGIAKLDFASRLSGANRILGTPAYMSPEQTRGGTLDQRTDVYSLGIVLYDELLTGNVPFDDRRPLEVLRMQMELPAPSVLMLRPDVPEVVAIAIARCLEKKADARPASMRELIEMLATVAMSRSAEIRAGSGASFAVGVRASAPSHADDAFAKTKMSITPLPPQVIAPRASAQPARASAQPVRASSKPAVAPARAPVAAPPRVSAGVIIAGAVLATVGTIALAAAVGILLRDRELTAPAAPITMAAPPSVPAPVIAAPVTSVVTPPAPTSPASVAPVVVPATHPHLLGHPAHMPIVAAPPPSVAPAPVAPPAEPEHPTIQVIDPWQ